MIPKLWLYGAVGIGAIILAGGIYTAGYASAKSKWKGELEKKEISWQAVYDAQAAETKAKEKRWAIQFKERDDAWEAKRAAYESTVAGLSSRVRRASSRSCGPLPTDSSAAGTPDGGRVHASVEAVERLSDDAWRAAAANTAKLNECVVRYNAITSP